MTKEDLEEYRKNLNLFIDSAQYEYRSTHPNCFYCECTKKGAWSTDFICQVKGIKIIKGYDDQKAKRMARWCKYYFPKTDLSNA